MIQFFKKAMQFFAACFWTMIFGMAMALGFIWAIMLELPTLFFVFLEITGEFAIMLFELGMDVIGDGFDAAGDLFDSLMGIFDWDD